MELKIRYKSFDHFFKANKDNFQRVQSARKSMKSLEELGMTGDALLNAEKLAYEFLNLKALISDLLFGLGASALDAKHEIKSTHALVFRELTGSAAEKKVIIENDKRIIDANQKFNDLNDLLDYLSNKKDDFEKCHYYYKNLTQGS